MEQESNVQAKQLVDTLRTEIAPIVRKRGSSILETTVDGVYRMPYYLGYEDFQAQAAADLSGIRMPNNPEVGITAYAKPRQYMPLISLEIDQANIFWITIHTDKMMLNRNGKLPALFELMQQIFPANTDIVGEGKKIVLTEGFQKLVTEKVTIEVSSDTLGNKVQMHGNSSDFGLPLLSVCNTIISEAASALHKRFPEKVTEISAKQLCQSCGYELQPTNKFCPNCGEKVKEYPLPS